MIVLDASVVVDAILCGPALARIESSDTPLVAPHLMDVEVLQAVRRLVRSGRISPALGDGAVDALVGLRVRRLPHRPLLGRAWELRENVTACDAVYLAMAERLGAVLLTRDHRLASVPGHEASVEVL